MSDRHPPSHSAANQPPRQAVECAPFRSAMLLGSSHQTTPNRSYSLPLPQPTTATANHCQLHPHPPQQAPECARQVRHVRPQDKRGKQVGAPAGQLAAKAPASHAAATAVAGPGHNVTLGLPLQAVAGSSGFQSQGHTGSPAAGSSRSRSQCHTGSHAAGSSGSRSQCHTGSHAAGSSKQ